MQHAVCMNEDVMAEQTQGSTALPSSTGFMQTCMYKSHPAGPDKWKSDTKRPKQACSVPNSVLASMYSSPQGTS